MELRCKGSAAQEPSDSEVEMSAQSRQHDVKLLIAGSSGGASPSIHWRRMDFVERAVRFDIVRHGSPDFG
jgi:hypothetical protein